MEEVAGTSADQGETETGEQEKVFGKTREEESIVKVVAAKKKLRYQIPTLTLPEIDDTLSKLLGIMVSVSFQTMLQASPRLLKGLRQLLTRRRVEVEEAPEPQEQETEEAGTPQGVSNLQRIPGDPEDREKAFADIRLSLPDREGGEVMRASLGTKLSFHALPVGKLKVQIGTHHKDALVDGGVKITLIRRDFVTITGCTVNKEVAGSIREAGWEIPFAGYVTKCAVRAGIKESILSLQRMTVMEEMDHDIILGRPWCAYLEMIGMHLHDGTYMVDIEDPVTGRGELLRLLETGGDPPKGKLATWSPKFKESARKGAFARMEERRYSQFKKEVLAILHCLKTFQAYLFGRRFILRIDPTNVVGALKNYKPIDPTVGRWIGFIWQFDYKVERIAGLRNRADGLSRVCITPEGVEDAEPIDAFLEYEGGTLVVDNEMAGATLTTAQLLIQTLEKGAPAVVAELREGPVTTIRRKDEKDLWGATTGPKEKLMTMVVEGGRDAVMNPVETWMRREQQYLMNQAQEGQDTDQKGREFFLIQMYDDIFREIGLLLIGNKQPMPTGEQATRQAGESSSRKRMLYVEFDFNLVVKRGGRNQGTRGPSPVREGEPIVLPSDSDTSSEEDGNLGKRQRMEEEEPNEIIDLSSEEEDDEVTTPTREVRGRDEDPGEEKDKWIREFGSSCSDRFDQWASIMRYEWAMRGKEKLSRGEDIAPTTFFTEEALLQLQRTKRKMQQEIDNRAREARHWATGR
ncbi:hypothetical protein CBR_g32676 [Chara braunii]|uniref:Reverse transcriptase RNase H-like domain-containing protein n=1 Tax=Chara braunii TaxID=69332 RepID=A0A388LHE7_CHABU|nr:hypothetical protein CBR_g32676 [Chara braunii]|eukprot:GBG81681.1 hypothetical protein CBR_g32676 [Chara braunii]